MSNVPESHVEWHVQQQPGGGVGADAAVLEVGFCSDMVRVQEEGGNGVLSSKSVQSVGLSCAGREVVMIEWMGW